MHTFVLLTLLIEYAPFRSKIVFFFHTSFGQCTHSFPCFACMSARLKGTAWTRVWFIYIYIKKVFSWAVTTFSAVLAFVWPAHRSSSGSKIPNLAWSESQIVLPWSNDMHSRKHDLWLCPWRQNLSEISRAAQKSALLFVPDRCEQWLKGLGCAPLPILAAQRASAVACWKRDPFCCVATVVLLCPLLLDSESYESNAAASRASSKWHYLETAKFIQSANAFHSLHDRGSMSEVLQFPRFIFWLVG